MHARFFSDDAVALEAELHRTLAHRRVNRANDRREFHFVARAEVRDILGEKVGGLLEFTEAIQYYQSVNGWPRSTAHRRTSK